MLEVVRISLKNWYLVDAQDLDIRGNTMLHGLNGSGKSSVLDALQVLMTGNSRVRLNSAADATGKIGRGAEETKRSVRNYMLGRVDTSKGYRTRRSGIVESAVFATAFDKDTGKTVSFGLLMSVDSTSTGQNETTDWRIVVPGHEFRIADYIRHENGSRVVASNDEILASIRSKKVAGVSLLANRIAAVDFVKELFKALGGGRPDPYLYARAVANVVKVKTLTSPDAFVRECLLPEVSIDLDEVRQVSADWHGIGLRIASYEAESENLGKTLPLLRAEISSEISRSAHKAATAAKAVDTAVKAQQQKQAQVEAAETEASQARIQASIARNLKEESQSALLVAEAGLMAARAGGGDLARELKAVEERRNRAVNSLVGILGPVKTAMMRLSKVSDFLPPRISSPAKQACASSDDASSVITCLEEIVAAKDECLPALSGALEADRNERALLAPILADSNETTRSRVAGTLESMSRRLVDELAQEGIQARPLFEELSIRPGHEKWTEAVERRLGSTRFEVIVRGPGVITRAHGVMNNLRSKLQPGPGGGGALSAIGISEDTEVIRRGAAQLVETSLADVVEATSPEGAIIIAKSIGRLTRVNSMEEMARYDSGVMTTGAWNSGASRKVTDTGRLEMVIGVSARENASKERALAAEQAKTRVGVLDNAIKARQMALDAIQLLCDTQPDNARAADSEMRAAFTEIERISALIAAVAGGNDVTTTAIQILETARTTLFAAKTAEAEAERLADIALKKQGIAEGEERGSRNLVETALHRWSHEADIYDKGPAARISAIIEGIGPCSSTDIRNAVSDGQVFVLLKENQDGLPRQANNVRNASPAASVMVDEESGSLMDRAAALFHAGSERLKELEGDVLLREKQGMHEASDKFTRVFREKVVMQLVDALRRMKDTFYEVNSIMGRHSFVGERLSFRYSAIHKYEDIIHFIEMAKSKPDDMFAPQQAEVDEIATRGMERIKRLILQEGDDIAAELADYRNYYSYDIEIRRLDEDGNPGRSSRYSEVRTGRSGGQRSAPFYVAIGAAMASIYHGREAGKGKHAGLGLIFLDEVFDNLDATVIRSILDYYGQLGLQVFCAAPPEKFATFGSRVSTVIDVERSEDKVLLTPMYTTELSRKEMEEANPDFLGFERWAESVPVDSSTSTSATA